MISLNVVDIILLQIGMLLQDVRNQRVNILANIVDLLVDVVQSSIIFAYALILSESLLFIWILFTRFNTCNSNSFGPYFDMEVDRVCELIKRRLNSMLSDHISDDGLSHILIDVQKLANLLKRNI